MTQLLRSKPTLDSEFAFVLFKTIWWTIVHHSFKSQFSTNEFITWKRKSLIILLILICGLNERVEALGDVNWITMNALNHLWDDLEWRSRVRLNSKKKYPKVTFDLEKFWIEMKISLSQRFFHNFVPSGSISEISTPIDSTRPKTPHSFNLTLIRTTFNFLKKFWSSQDWLNCSAPNRLTVVNLHLMASQHPCGESYTIHSNHNSVRLSLLSEKENR